MSIYGGSKKYLTHQQVAEESGIEVKDVKFSIYHSLTNK
jgi:hypothetical protein